MMPETTFDHKNMKNHFLSILIVTAYLFRFLTGNLYGVLLLLSGIYFLAPLVTDIKFLTFSELILLFQTTSSEFKSLVISSSLTVIGFLIAFQTATKNWKDQLQANLRLDASREIDQAYNRATHLINRIRIYADQFAELGAKIEETGLTEETLFGIHYHCQQGSKFIQDRAELSDIHISVFSMYGRYMNMLLSCGNSFKNLHLANKYLKQVADQMWILVPNINLKSQTLTDDFMRYFDRNKLTSLSRQCELSSQAINGLTGHVKSQLNSKIMEFNFRFVYSFIKFGPLFLDMSRAIKKGEVVSDELFEKFEQKI